MISAAQAARRRKMITAKIEQAFPTTIELFGVTGIAAARWTSATGGVPELAGILPSTDLVIRVRRKLLPVGKKIVPGQTTIKEAGKSHRIDRVRDALNDPAIVLECKTL